MSGSDYLLGRSAAADELAVAWATPPSTGRAPVENADQSLVLSSSGEATGTSTTFDFTRSLNPGVEGALNLSDFEETGLFLIFASCSTPGTLAVANHGGGRRGGLELNLFTGIVGPPAPVTFSPTPAPGPSYDYEVVLEEATGHLFKWSVVGDELHAEMTMARGSCWMGLGFNNDDGGFYMVQDSDYILGFSEGADLTVKRADSTGFCEPPNPVDDAVTIVDSSAETSEMATTFRFVRKLNSGVDGVLNLLDYPTGVNMIWARCQEAGQMTVNEHASFANGFDVGAGGLRINLFPDAVTSSPTPAPGPTYDYEVVFDARRSIC
jgi:hypothetical protein